MNKDRKILLIILFFSLVASLSFMNIFIMKEKKTNLMVAINITEKKYTKMAVVNPEISEEYIVRLKELIEEEKSNYFHRNKVDPYEFGQEIKALLESNNIYVKSYKTTEKNELYLIEFSIEASSYNFFSFFKALYNTGKNYSIPYFSLKNEKRGITSTFKIGYSIYE